MQVLEPARMADMKHSLEVTAYRDMDTIVRGMINRRRWIWWSRFTSEDFLMYGSASPFLQNRWPDKSVTNMRQAGQFSPPYCLVTLGLMLLMDRDTSDEALASFDKNVNGELFILDKIFSEFPASLVTCRADIDGLVNRETSQPTEFISGKFLKMDPPLCIPPLTRFEVKLSALRSWSVPKFSGYVLLEGWTDFPVQ